MTQKELSQYYWLKKEIEVDERRLQAMKEKALSPRSQKLTGMPGGGGSKDPLGETVAEITDLERKIRRKQKRCIQQLKRIEDYIDAIPDSMTRTVFTLRCVDGMTWREVASNMGYRMSEANAKRIFYQYLRGTEGEKQPGENSSRKSPK